MVVGGESFEAVRTRLGEEGLDDERLAAFGETYRGKTRGELKELSERLVYFTPDGREVASALGLLLAGFLLTRARGWRGKS